ncbi:major capsid protein [Arthrobacter phage CallinAllBarbz]|uniref:Major capsid protein n=1 Tax=Arthrobacter phage CallinAllBarbz TaxID=3077790 RepID=A0AA96KHH1_9CAUD|nr:major capsid protein [Arthrobacter phage CallinAllBarbz]
MSTFSLAGQTGPGQAALLPKNVSTNIWQKATAKSIVPSLATSTPIIIGENTFPTVTKRPAASIVGEGQNKPDSEIAMGSKTIKPIKAVVGLEFTLESILANPGGILGLLEAELAGALARQIDLAILHGRQASDGAALSGGLEYVNQTTNRVELATGGNVDAELWAGYGTVVEGDNDFTGFAMDPRLVFALANARDDNGRRLNPDIQMGSAVTSYAGQPTAVSKSVSGQVDASVDTKVRAFGGDWDALKFGYSFNLSTKRIEYGDPFGNGDLQRRNSVAFLTEAIFGWAIMDLDAFVAYEEPVA